MTRSEWTLLTTWLVSAVLMAFGAFLLFPPLGPIVGGVLLAAIGYMFHDDGSTADEAD